MEKELNHLLDSDIANMGEAEAKEALKHYRDQMRIRYKYLVGEWQGAKRAKSSQTGVFVAKQEVVDYLDE